MDLVAALDGGDLGSISSLTVTPSLVSDAATCARRAWLSAESGAGLSSAPAAELQYAYCEWLLCMDGEAGRAADAAAVVDGEGAHLYAVGALSSLDFPYAELGSAAGDALGLPGLLPPVDGPPAAAVRRLTRVRVRSGSLLTTPVFLSRCDADGNEDAAGDAWAVETVAAKAPPTAPALRAAFELQQAFLLHVCEEALGTVAAVRVAVRDADGSFALCDVTEAARNCGASGGGGALPPALEAAAALEGVPAAPDVELIPACSTCPYFAEHCMPAEARTLEAAADAAEQTLQPARRSVFSVPRLRFAEKARLWGEGVRHADEAGSVLVYEGVEPKVNKEEVSAFLDLMGATGGDACHYLDFEATAFAVPRGALWGGAVGYEPVPVQYSLHSDARGPGTAALDTCVDDALLRHARSGQAGDLPAGVRHSEFLAVRPEVDDPRERLAAALVADLDDGGASPVVVWNASYERGVLRRLGERYAQHRAALARVEGRLLDLNLVFSKRHYQHRAFRGSTSLKAVLPVLSPTLGQAYATEEIAQGTAASLFVSKASRGLLEHKAVVSGTRSLLQYCRVDTAAMLAVASALKRAIR
eukprot:Rhum_TRINITY_DN13091_c0_g1::Rhum_TRINITY_DN13091_c0_g1_i1::g.56835::m.56835